MRSTTGDLDLDQIYKKGIKVSVEAGEYGQTRQKVWFERFQWFLAAAVILLGLEFFSESTKLQQGIASK